MNKKTCVECRREVSNTWQDPRNTDNWLCGSCYIKIKEKKSLY